MKENLFNTKRWLGIALINFCVVALAGVTMRYKINFALPGVDQKYLMHAHSNFAFVGWVSIALMTMMVRFLILHGVETNYLKYSRLFIVNVIIAYAMFIAFILQGYALFSIAFSTISILISFLFIYFYWKDLDKVKEAGFSQSWLKAGLLLWAFSSLGAFMLAYLMAKQIMIQDLYFASLYFFLHFQYNGWFLFICFGIFFAYLHRHGLTRIVSLSRRLFIIMAVTVVPTYFLSILWLRLPAALHWIAYIAAILQLLVLVYFIQMLSYIKKSASIKFHPATRWLWGMAGFAFILKVVLQMLSILPFLSNFAFGFRPVIIGYLHLSFIGIISLFIFGYINEFIHRFSGKVSGIGMILFVIGFVMQELILMMQGLEAMNVEPVKFASIALFYCAFLMAAGMIWTTIGIIKTPKNELIETNIMQ